MANERCKVQSEGSLCDNRPNVSLPKRSLSDTQLILSDAGALTHAQNRYVEHQ